MTAIQNMLSDVASVFNNIVGGGGAAGSGGVSAAAAVAAVAATAAAVFFVARAIGRRRLRSAVERRYVGKNVIITGASSGIGRQMAIRCAQLGAGNIVVCARRTDKLQETVALCQQAFAANGALGKTQRVHAIEVDVSVDDDCRRLVERSVGEFFSSPITGGGGPGRIDLLFLNAGITSVKRFKDFANLDVHRNLMDVNYFGYVQPIHYALPYLLKQSVDKVTGLSAEIAVVSSLAGKTGVKYRTAYSSTKFALQGFMEALRVELLEDEAKTPIGLTIHCPGFVLTEIHDKSEGGSKIKRVDMSKFQTAEACVQQMLEAQARGVFNHVMDPTVATFLKLAPFLPLWVTDGIRRRKEGGVKPVADE